NTTVVNFNAIVCNNKHNNIIINHIKHLVYCNLFYAIICRKFLTYLCKRYIIKVYMISLTNEGGKGMKKFNLFLVLVLSLVFVLAACGPDRPEPLEAGGSAGGEDPEAGNEPEEPEGR